MERSLQGVNGRTVNNCGRWQKGVKHRRIGHERATTGSMEFKCRGSVWLRHCQARSRGIICRASHNREEDPTTIRAQRWLQRQRVLRQEVRPTSGDLLELNVGGRYLVTQRSTLTQVEGSRLQHMFAPTRDALLPRDRRGVVFLDFDPDAFTLLLRYLRELKAAGGVAAAVPPPDMSRAEFACVKHLLESPGEEQQQPSAACLEGGPSAAAVFAIQQGYQQVLKRPLPPPGTAAAAAAAGGSNSPWLGSSTGSVPLGFSASSSSKGMLPSLRSSPASAAFAIGGDGLLGNPEAESSLFYVYGEQVHHPQKEGGETSSSNSGTGKGRQQNPVFQVSILTEEDQAEVTAAAAAAAAAGRKGVSLGRPLVCDVTRSSDSLSFSFVAWKGDNIDNMFVGVTTTSQVHQHGLQIPCFGWKQKGGSGKAEQNPSSEWLNPDGGKPQGSGARGSQSGGVAMQQPSAAAAAAAALAAASKAGEVSSAEKWSGVFTQWNEQNRGASSSSSRPLPKGLRPPPRRRATGSHTYRRHGGGRQPQQDEQGGGSYGASPTTARPPSPMWCPGDHVELKVEFGGIHTLSLRINGKVQDVVRGLPSSSDWCWYLALFSGLEVVSVVFEKESYSVYAGNYKTVRYLV